MDSGDNDEPLPPPPCEPEVNRSQSSRLSLSDGGGRLKSLTNEKLLEITQDVREDDSNTDTLTKNNHQGECGVSEISKPGTLGLPAPVQPTTGRADSYRHAVVGNGQRDSQVIAQQPAALEEGDECATDVAVVVEEVRCSENEDKNSISPRTEDVDTTKDSRTMVSLAESPNAGVPMPVVHVSEDEVLDYENGGEAEVQELQVVDLSAVAKSKKSSPKKKKRFWGYFKKPWKLWRRKKPSSKVLEIHEVIGRKISFRPDRNEVIALGIVKEDDIHPDATVLPPPNVDIDRASSTASVLGRPQSQEKTDGGEDDVPTQFLNITEPAGFGPRGTRKGSVKGTPVALALEKRISLRQSKKDLADRNIIRDETPEETEARKASVRGILAKRISQRKTVEELKEAKILKFDQYVDVFQTYRGSQYNRAGDRPWTQLTTKDKIRIKKELNEFKAEEMDVHPDSAKYTRFHK
mmetsp:Transcript_1757/g.2606  ORF Transcript_1757/g.2606 Transcript_1757/m.2606 type:complete len:465 (-) Transcript_1757:4-1398(-)